MVTGFSNGSVLRGSVFSQVQGPDPGSGFYKMPLIEVIWNAFQFSYFNLCLFLLVGKDLLKVIYKYYCAKIKFFVEDFFGKYD